MAKPIPMSATMASALGEMIEHGGKLVRYVGGYWSTATAERDWQGNPAWFIGENTMNALVKRERVQFTEWKDGRNGQFPIAAEVVEQSAAA